MNNQDIIKSKAIITYTSQHLLVLLTVEQLINISPIRWIHNRPADEIRIINMAISIYRNRPAFDTIIHINYNSVSNQYEILDGLHRYSAIKHIYDNNSRINPDFITGDEYGHGRNATWFYNAPILISLHIDKTPGELHLLFENLNKTVPVSEIYIPTITNVNNLRKQKVMEAVANWQRRYPKHFSASNLSHIPNINRDRFMDILAELYDVIGTEIELDAALNLANERFCHDAKQNHLKITESISKKCNDTGCWLFVYKGDNLISKIVEVVRCYQ